MTVGTPTDLLEVIAHMRPGSVYRSDNVSWAEYEQLLANLGEGYAVRIFYDQGRIEIMSPSYGHERAARLIHPLLSVLRDELDIDIESVGSTTLKEEMKAKGAGPDDSFYVQHATHVIDKDDLDLKHGPPPDIVVESDRSNSSLDKFPIYAGLGVPEIWRIHQRQVRIWLLVGDAYQESPRGRAFPFLPAKTRSEFLAKGLTEGERKATRAFRAWVREHRPTD